MLMKHYILTLYIPAQDLMVTEMQSRKKQVSHEINDIFLDFLVTSAYIIFQCNS